MLPQRPAGSSAAPAARLSSSVQTVPLYEILKVRVVAKLEDRLDPSSSKRMPASLLRQSIRTFAEQIVETDAKALSKPERERLMEEALAELLGYGPLEELFKDATVREVLVVGPQVVIVRREMGNWLPTSVKFRDDEHLITALDRLATHADPVGGVTTSVNLFDLKLPNGFRAVGVIPPPALGTSPSVAFIRIDTATLAQSPLLAETSQPSGRYPIPSPTGSGSAANMRPVPGSITASPRPGSGTVGAPTPRTGVTDTSPPGDHLTRHRNRIIERLISKLAHLGVYDLKQIEITELRRAVLAYIREYCDHEKILLSDAEQGRLMLEILAAMNR